jgi:hypothetical protein
MKVADCFESARHGWLISGSNKMLDNVSRNDIEKMIGDQVLIRSEDGAERIYGVRGIDLSSSIVGRLNITISLGKAVDVSHISAGAQVLQILGEQ